MVLEPNVRVLAARLRECIEKAEAAGPFAAITPPPLIVDEEAPLAANDTAPPSVHGATTDVGVA
jgi:hypothetical protein